MQFPRVNVLRGHCRGGVIEELSNHLLWDVVIDQPRPQGAAELVGGVGPQFLALLNLGLHPVPRYGFSLGL